MVRRLAGGLIAERPREGRPGDDPRRQRHRFRARLFRRRPRSAASPSRPRSMLTAEEALALAADSGASAIVLGDADPNERALFSPSAGLRPATRRSGSPPKAAPADYAPTAPDDPAYLVFTSGSTAEPKGVLHAHRVVIGRRPMADDWLGLARGRRRPPRRQHQLDLYARRRRARSFRARRDRRALRRPARPGDLARA